MVTKTKKQCFQLFLDRTHSLDLDVHFFSALSATQVKLQAKKFGAMKLNLYRPELEHQLRHGNSISCKIRW